MVEISEDLRTLFSARLDAENGQYVFEVPSDEVQHGTLEVGDSYRVAVLPTDSPGKRSDTDQVRPSASPPGSGATDHDAPVTEGEQRRVEIEELGDEGDGVATIDGFVVFVDGAVPGDRPLVEFDKVTDTMAFANIVDDSPQTSSA